MIDYAQHLIRIERLAKEASDLCLDRKYIQARDSALELMAESKLLAVTLVEMHDKAAPLG